MATIHEKIKTLAKTLDLTIPEFARELGYDRADNFYSITSGRSKPGWEIIESIARRFPQVNLNWLLRDDSQVLLNESAPPSTLPPAILSEESKKLLARYNGNLESALLDLRNKELLVAERDKWLADKDKIIRLLEKRP